MRLCARLHALQRPARIVSAIDAGFGEVVDVIVWRIADRRVLVRVLGIEGERCKPFPVLDAPCVEG